MNEFSTFYNKHYVTLDEQNRIIAGFSDAFLQPDEDDVCISDKGGYQFRLFPDGEENPMLFEFPAMIPLYKWDGEKVILRDKKELDEERAIAQSKADRLARLNELHQLLRDTDYIAAKIAEGAATKKEYAEQIAQRQAWRDEINELTE